MWNCSDGSCLKRFVTRSRQEICDVICIQTQGRVRFVTAGWDKQLSLFEDDAQRKSIDVVAMRSGHRADVTVLAKAADAAFVASGDVDGVVLVWNTQSWTIKRKLSSSAGFGIIRMGFLSETWTANVRKETSLLRGMYRWRFLLVTLNEDGTLYLWHVLEGTVLCEHRFSFMPTAMAVHRHHPTIAVGSDAGRVEVRHPSPVLNGYLIFQQLLEIEASANRWHIALRKGWQASPCSVSCISWMHHRDDDDDHLLVATADLKITVWSSDGEWTRVLGCPMKLPLYPNAASESQMAIRQDKHAQQNNDSTYRTTTGES